MMGRVTITTCVDTVTRAGQPPPYEGMKTGCIPLPMWLLDGAPQVWSSRLAGPGAPPVAHHVRPTFIVGYHPCGATPSMCGHYTTRGQHSTCGPHIMCGQHFTRGNHYPSGQHHTVGQTEPSETNRPSGANFTRGQPHIGQHNLRGHHNKCVQLST